MKTFAFALGLLLLGRTSIGAEPVSAPANVTHAPGQAANETLTVQYDADRHGFTLTDHASGKVFVKDGQLDDAGALLREEAATDPVFGAGWRIVIARNGGGEIALEVFPNLPFALVREVMKNGQAAQADIQKAVPATFTLDLGKPAGELKTLGTGGLLAADKNPGSYLFLTAVDPATRDGVVAGWFTQDRGSGVVFSSVTGQGAEAAVEFKAQIDYGHLRIPAGQSAALETLAIGHFKDARLGEEAWADAVKQQYAIKLRSPDATYCTWYTEGKGHGGAGNEKNTLELSKFIARELKPFGLGIIQIDDQWQDGPRVDGPSRGFERANPKGPYPHGMEPIAKALDHDGITLGLWWLPFGRNHAVPEYKDRQDWFAKWADGRVMRTHAFGGTCLDLTNPQVQEQFARIAKMYRDWGVKYYKMDGAWTGTATEIQYVNDGYKDDHMSNVAPFHDPLKTQIEAYRDGWKLLRKNAGDDVFFSGCCISQNMRSMNCMGLVDSMRVGPDNSDPMRASRLYFMNGRVWWNDPDPSKVRAAVPLERARLNASWVALAGQFFLVSDWLPDLPPERLEILKRTLSHHNGTARPVDVFERNFANTWLVTDDQSGVRRAVIGVFNWGSTPLEVTHTLAKLGVDATKTYHAFDFWSNAPVADFKDEFKTSVAPNACRVIAVRQVEDHPVLISTSRHVSSGILEVKQERWADKTLSGVSEVVGHDPYELRIVGLRDGGKLWVPTSVTVSEEDRAAGVAISQALEPGLLRVKIVSVASRAVQWRVAFDPKVLPAE